MKGEKAARIQVAVMEDGQISTTSFFIISGNSDPNYKIFDVGVSGGPAALAETTRANDMDANNWVGFWVKTEHFDTNVLHISLGKEDITEPILVANLTGWGSKSPTHVSFSYGQTPVKFKNLRGEDPSIEPSMCSGETFEFGIFVPVFPRRRNSSGGARQSSSKSDGASCCGGRV